MSKVFMFLAIVAGFCFQAHDIKACGDNSHCVEDVR